MVSALEAFMDIVRQELIAGNRVDISEFGVFQALKQQEYVLVDLEAGERYLMPPSVEVVFEAAVAYSDSEMIPDAKPLQVIPDAAFEEEANGSFALFEPTLINEGVYFPGLAEVVINEPKATGEEGGAPDTFDTPGTHDTPDTPDTPEISEIPGTPEIPEIPGTPEMSDTPEFPEMNKEGEAIEPSRHCTRSLIWIPVIGGAVVALVAFLFSRRRDFGE